MLQRLTIVLITLLTLTGLIGLSHASTAQNVVVQVEVTDVITEGTYNLLKGGLELAEANSAPLLVLLNTPGGSLDATRKITEAFLNAKVPVIAYVHPRGATAWSAGTFLLLASHVAAMSPNTVIGSCQPVAYNPTTGGSEPVTEPKIINAVVKNIEELAKAHGRNSTTAKLFVTENLNLGPEEALKLHVIEYVASSVEELLATLNGITVKTASGSFEIKTLNPRIIRHEGGFTEALISFFSNPLIASILFIVGLYALIFGAAYANPAPASVGAFMLLLSMLGMGFKVNVVAIALLALGIVLILVEVFLIPGFGAVGATGIAMLILGALLNPFRVTPEHWLIYVDWYQILLLASISITLPLAGFTVFAIYKVIKARRMKPKLYISGLEGRVAEAVDEITTDKEGFVICEGEYWRAKTEEGVIKPGEKVIVTGKEGVVLKVKRKA
ncbi:MAG: nodulation protein NfeD [Candidatus Nezhaarchaeales archaeon]